MKSILAAIVMLVVLATGGCKKNKRSLPVPAPPTPQAQPAPPPPPEPVPAPTKTEPAVQPVQEPEPQEPQETKPAPKKHPAKPQQPPPTTTPPGPEAPPPQPVPQLGVILTPEQRQKYEADYAASMASAQHGLVLAAEYKLTPAQTETVSRIKSFMRLAENVHERDPATAAQLARRAALLAEDLLKTLQ